MLLPLLVQGRHPIGQKVGKGSHLQQHRPSPGWSVVNRLETFPGQLAHLPVFGDIETSCPRRVYVDGYTIGTLAGGP